MRWGFRRRPSTVDLARERVADAEAAFFGLGARHVDVTSAARRTMFKLDYAETHARMMAARADLARALNGRA